MNLFIRFLLIGVSVGALVACSSFEDDAPPLEGERLSVLELSETLEPDDEVLEAQGLIAPQEWQNEFWPQVGGYPNHSMQNLQLSNGPLKKAWSADIGQGSTDELPLTAQPIVVDGKVFTLDTDFQLSAFDIKSGKQVWNTNIADPDEDDPVIGGGISFASGVLYATNGYGEILALNPGNGEIIWRKPLAAPSRAAPTVMDGRIFITTLDNRLLALDASDGSLLWEHLGISESAGLIGGVSPAVSRDIVVPVFSSGEITALRVGNGSVAWTDNLANLRRIGGLAGLSDIKALPVIDKGLVIGVSYSGKLAAIDERTGERVWQREIASANTPWMAGNHMFVLTTDNQLVALGRDTGAIRWVTKIKRKDDEGKFYMAGPILAGGRLILAGSEGFVMEINPETGETLRDWDAGGAVIISPVVAGGTLYILSEDGTLSAYR
jgi:outer membrane protein assembly factor BamB